MRVRKKHVLAAFVFLLIFMTLTAYADENQEDYLPDTVKAVQEALNDLGYDCGTPDGIAGSNTKNAIARYKKDRLFSELSSEITEELLASLRVKTTPQDEYLYEMAESLDPGITLQISDTGLNMERRYDGEGADHIEEFLQAACRILKVAVEDGRFTSMTATFQAENCFEPIRFNGIEGKNEFVTEYYGPMSSDAEVKLAFPAFYKSVFGAHDKTARSESDLKESAGNSLSGGDVPADYRNGRYWVYYSFDGQDCVITGIDDEEISLQLSTNNSIEGGWNACRELSEAMEMYTYLCDTDPLSMPYTKLTVEYTDRAKGTSLYIFTMEKMQDDWKMPPDSAANPFANGFAAFGKGLTLDEAVRAYTTPTPTAIPALSVTPAPTQTPATSAASEPSTTPALPETSALSETPAPTQAPVTSATSSLPLPTTSANRNGN